jgi:hypothetical protein
MGYIIFIDTNKPMLLLAALQMAYPSGLYSEDHGCFYFLDHDGDLGYFIAYENGTFEDEAQYVDLDCIDDDVREECLRVAATIATSQ